MKVEIFIPCHIDQFFPEVGMKTVEILKQADCQVHYNQQQTCCGKPAFMAGATKASREVAEKYLDDFSEKGFIVCPSGACVSFVKNYYGEMFENAALHNAYKSVQKNIYDLPDFLVKETGVIDFGASLNAIAVLLEPCNCNTLNSRESTLKLLDQVEGLVVSSFNDDLCCGFGDIFSGQYDSLSKTMAKHKLDAALDKNADVIISNEMTCLMHLDAIIKEEQYPLKVMHIVEVLTSYDKLPTLKTDGKPQAESQQ